MSEVLQYLYPLTVKFTPEQVLPQVLVLKSKISVVVGHLTYVVEELWQRPLVLAQSWQEVVPES